MPPPAISRDVLLALIQLDRVRATEIRVMNTSMLRNYYFPLAGSDGVHAEQAPRAVRNPAIHRLTDDLRYK